MQGLCDAPRCGKLAIVSSRASADSDHKLAKLAVMMGLDPIVIEQPQSATWEELLGDSQVRECTALAASDLSISPRLLSSPWIGEIDASSSNLRSILLYACDQTTSHSNARHFPAELTKGALGPPVELASSSVTVSLSDKLPAGCEQLRGLSFAATGSPRTLRAFQAPAGNGGRGEVLLTLEQMPLLARYHHAAADLFLLASGRIVDIDDTVPAGGMTGAAYLELVPWLIFLRAAFGEACWHNPYPRGCLIIDDPPLRPRYGFLRYHDLLNAIEAHDFAASIAFIPWNHRRSHPQTVEMFKGRPERLSLCVHGSDHTGGEFKSGNETALRRKVQTAVSRMHDHHVSTGVGFDRVMIFPQGGFCKAALRAIWAEDFLAAINTSAFAADCSPQDLSYRDLLDVAITSYGGCPLFSRHYPGELFPFAFDLFMGKPAFVVQHHGDFRQGCGPITGFIQALNQQDCTLLWNSPGRIIEEAALRKFVSPREQWIRFYTDSFSFQNPTGNAMTYRLHRRLADSVNCVGVERDGEPLEYEIDNSTLVTELVLAPGEAARLRVHGSKTDSVCDVRASAMYRARVASRRLLSEFRDNYVARNQWLLSTADGIKRFVQQHNQRRPGAAS